MSLSLRIVFLIFGLITVVGGIKQIKSGVREMRGESDPGLTQLSQQIDQAVDEANKSTLEAQPMFQKALDEIDRIGLAAAR